MADASGAMIAVRRLGKTYETSRGAVPALEDIDFTVAEGEFVAILGPSGCGKTTLLKILAGLLPTTRGLIHDPAMLLMDEPFGALDAMTRETMNLELQRIWLEKRKTVLFITHSIAEAVFLADRVLVMTPRPGHILDSVAVEMPRPRSLDVMSTPAFGEHVRRIRTHFNAKGGVEA